MKSGCSVQVSFTLPTMATKSALMIMISFLLISISSSSSLKGFPSESEALTVPTIVTSLPLHNQTDSKLGSCQYNVEIRTSCSLFAGTDDPISLVFGDGYGYRVYVPRLDDRFKDTFERCQTDTFSIVGPCVYDICYLYLYRHGSDNWKPSYVKVYFGKRVYKFKYDTKVPADTWFGFDLCGYLQRSVALSSA